jgi:endonuclease YncB( thermonuclease family)
MFSCFNIFNKKSSSSTLSTDTLKYGKFNLENVSGNFLVDSVYDGDTITLMVPIKMEIYNMNSPTTLALKSTNTNNEYNIKLNKIKVRLFGIDTHELKPSKNLINREANIAKAKEARDFLSNMILNKLVKVKFLQNDKYGRPLVRLYANNVEGKEICLNDLMISKGFAKKYDGGTKDSDFTDLVDIVI